jgi:hypothetical protein
VTPKESRPCCKAHIDGLGRLPIGFCSPECVGRTERDVMLAARGTSLTAKFGRRYTQDEKWDAISLARRAGIGTAALVAGCSTTTLREWMRSEPAAPWDILA